MSELNMRWNTQKVKTIIRGQDGRQIIVDAPAIQIVNQPNRNRTESIISALCICVSELVDIQEQQALRIQKMLEEKFKPEGEPMKKGQ